VLWSIDVGHYSDACRSTLSSVAMNERSTIRLLSVYSDGDCDSILGTMSASLGFFHAERECELT
jgi:hypothetical protein